MLFRKLPKRGKAVASTSLITLSKEEVCWPDDRYRFPDHHIRRKYWRVKSKSLVARLMVVKRPLSLRHIY